MIKSTKALDSDGWLRRLGQQHDLGEADCAALSAFIQLPVVALSGAMTPDQPYNPRVLTFRGSYEIRLERECVVSLEPFEESMSGTFERSYRLSPSAPPVPEAAEEAEDFPYEGLSLMDMLGDEVALSLTAFPRKPDAALPEHPQDERPEAEERVNPFAVLEQLKR